MDKKIELMAEYFISNKYPDLHLVHIDQNKIVIEHIESKLKIAIPFNNDINFDDLSEEVNGLEDKDAMDHFNDEMSFNFFTSNNKAFFQLNPAIQVFENVGYRYKNTVECLLSYSVFLYEPRNDNHILGEHTFNMWDFCIDNIHVRIGDPSSLFQIIFREYEDDDYYVGWNSYTTVLLYGVNKENYYDYLQQAMFWIYKMCPSPYDYDFPRFGALSWEVSEGEADFGEIPGALNLYKEEYERREFKSGVHPEPIHFYNAAKRAGDKDVAYLNYYRILEYYFFITQQDSIKEIIDTYQNTNSIEYLISTMQKKYFGQNEDLSLYAMLKTLPSKFINELCDYAYSAQLILSNELTVLSREIFYRRNSIAHGKAEFKNLFLKVPNQLDDESEKSWTILIERIADYLINKYCFCK